MSADYTIIAYADVDFRPNSSKTVQTFGFGAEGFICTIYHTTDKLSFFVR